MKKIVALVLSLVMALSLCATAFAVGSVPTGSTVYDVATGKETNISLSSVKAVTNKDGSGYVAYYVEEWSDPAFNAYVYVNKATGDVQYFVDGVGHDQDKQNELIGKGYEYKGWTEGIVIDHFRAYIPCEKADATHALYKNGAMKEWLVASSEIDTFAPAYYCDTVKAQKATKDLPNCTTSQYLEDGYVNADGDFYVDGSRYPVNYDGKIIYVDYVGNDWDYVIHASHIFAKGVKNDKTGYDVATCLICKGEFACTNDELVATKNGYKISTGFEYDTELAREVYDANKYNNGYDFAWGQTYATNYAYCWQLKPGTTEEIGTKPATDTKTGVDSAKTFDAGIAMYVGMSLLSVAGSAVVIGKKKEF